MPKINVYLPDELAAAVRDAQVPVSAVCQAALERAVRDVGALRASDDPPANDQRHGPFTRFTPRARDAITCGQKHAVARGDDHVGTEHLLLGVLDEGGNVALKVLRSLEVEPDDVRSELLASMEARPDHIVKKARFAPAAKKTLESATKEALALGHNYVGCEHLLLALIATEEGLASRVLRRMGVELRTTRRAVVTALVGLPQAQPKADPATATPPVLEEILRRLEAIERGLAS